VLEEHYPHHKWARGSPLAGLEPEAMMSSNVPRGYWGDKHNLLDALDRAEKDLGIAKVNYKSCCCC